ncbi:YdcF family protein [Patescibacteria group bacterium]|nr:YdcF family protein [Patescibacteria group bacterium]
MKIYKNILIYLIVIIIYILFLIFFDWKIQDLKKYDFSEVPKKDIVIVFGAGIKSDGSPSDVLADRVKVASELYLNGKAKKILMSGDNSTKYHDESTAMKKYAKELGVPEKDIVLDFAGFNTYSTCVRADKIFSVNNAILVTQDYHLNRALYLCNKVGVNSVGVNADLRKYILQFKFSFREIFAFIDSWFNINFIKRDVVLGDPIKIYYN